MPHYVLGLLPQHLSQVLLPLPLLLRPPLKLTHLCRVLLAPTLDVYYVQRLVDLIYPVVFLQTLDYYVQELIIVDLGLFLVFGVLILRVLPIERLKQVGLPLDPPQIEVDRVPDRGEELILGPLRDLHVNHSHVFVNVVLLLLGILDLHILQVFELEAPAVVVVFESALSRVHSGVLDVQGVHDALNHVGSLLLVVRVEEGLLLGQVLVEFI